MKILLVSSYLPYPLYSGGHIRLYNLLQELSKNNEITLVCEARKDQTASDIEVVKKLVKELHVFPRKKQWSLETITKTGISENAFLITGHNLPEMKALVTRLLIKEAFDVIHVETSYVLQNVPKTNIPIILTEHNLEYKVYEKYVNAAPFIIRPILRIDVKKLKKQEEIYWKQVSFVVAVSEHEKNSIAQFTNKVGVVPNGVDIHAFKLKKYKDTGNHKQVLFIGDFRWIQNRDTAVYILEHIWPKIIQKIPSATLRIVGKNIPDALIRLHNKSSVIFSKNTNENTQDIFSGANMLLSPIRVGGGTQYKILEAMAVGTPVVTNTLGSVGLLVSHNKNILIGNTTEELANLTAEVLESNALAMKIGVNSRKLIEKEYSWKTIAKSLEQIYKNVRL